MTLNILIVDDEEPARRRIRQLLDDIAPLLPIATIEEASNGLIALEKIKHGDFSVVLLDIRMPVMDGLQLALQLNAVGPKPRIIFVTAYDQYAVRAFDLSATDYLLKPVKADRLREALLKVRLDSSASNTTWQSDLVPSGRTYLCSASRDKLMLVPVSDILFLRAEQKYVTAYTRTNEFLIDESLSHLESEFPDVFIRIHRNCLVAKNAIIACVRDDLSDEESEASWQLLLKNSPHRLSVSRRQLPAVRQSLKT